MIYDLSDQMLFSGDAFGVFGSCRWGGGGVKELEEFASKSSCKFMGPVVEAMGVPTEEDLSKLDEMAHFYIKRSKEFPLTYLNKAEERERVFKDRMKILEK